MGANEPKEPDTPILRHARLTEAFAAAHIRLLTLAVALLGGVAMINATRVGGFRDDDFSSLGIGQDYGLSLTSLVGKSGTYEHLVPSAGVLSLLVGASGPHWWLVVALEAGFVAALTALVVMLVRELGASALLALLVGAIVATSIVFEATGLWWSAASGQLPMLVFATATILLSLRWNVRRSQSLFALAVLSQVAACSFYDRAQIVPVIVFFLLVIATPANETIRTRDLVTRARAAAPLVGALLGVALAQLVITLSLPGVNSANLSAVGHYSAGKWLGLVFDWWTIGVGSTIENQFPVFSISPTSKAYVAPIGMLILIALAVATIRNGRSAAIWASAFAIVTLSGLQVGAVRSGYLGAAAVATVARYQELTVLVLATFIPAAWVAAGRPFPRSPAGVYFLSIVVIFAALGWTWNLVDGLTIQQRAPLVAAAYARNYEASLKRWNAGGKPFTLVDQRLPETVVFAVPATGDYNRLSKATRILAPGVDPPDLYSLSGVFLVADQRGVMTPVDVGPMRRVGPSKTSCGTSARSANWLEPGGVVVATTFPKDVAKSEKELILTVRLSETTGEGRVFIVGSQSPWPLTELDLGSYPDGLRTSLPAGSTGATVQFWLGAGGCVDSVEVGEIR